MTAYDPANIFARMLRGEIPCHKVFEDEVALAFMDIMPRADGHVLVIPKLPVRTLLDIAPEALAALVVRLQRVASAAVTGMGADGLTLLQSNEPAGGQEVFHLHFHLLPRWTGVPLREPGGPVEPPDRLGAQAARIRAALSP